MSVYLHSGSVILHSGAAAVGSACCCGNGACCHFDPYFGACTDEASYLCTGYDVFHAGQSCATVRCEGACSCCCDEFGSCSQAWLLGGNCATAGCEHFFPGCPSCTCYEASTYDECAVHCGRGACCEGGGPCSMLFRAECEDSGGTWFGGSCTPNPCCAVGQCEDPYGPEPHNCAGYYGFMTGAGCYCTVTETGNESCSTTSEAGTYGRDLHYTYIRVYGYFLQPDGNCLGGLESESCSCTLTRHFRDGSSTTCNCCGPCAAGFCGDAGGHDCSCTDAVTSDTTYGCSHSDGGAGWSCSIDHTVTLS